MGLGKVLSFISPAVGAVTGQGIGKVLPYVSPAYGLATGKGPFPDLLSSLLGIGGQGQHQTDTKTPMTGDDSEEPGLSGVDSLGTGSNNALLGSLLIRLLTGR